MEKRVHILFAVVVTLLVLISAAWAEDEQWLQYCSARQTGEILGYMSSWGVNLSGEKPKGVELPVFECNEPLFGQWHSPMAKNGQLWIALDRKGKSGPYTRLFIDSNGDGQFKDETAVTAYRIEQNQSYFGPVKVVFDSEDGPITYHLNFQFYNYNERKNLSVTSGCWYEGVITVAGEKKHCVLIDFDVNGTFNDKSVNSGESDRVRIGKEGDRDTRFVGNFIEVDGVLYRSEIARDGAYIKLTKSEGVTYGDVQVPETITEFAAGGENGLFIRRPEKGTGKLPLGKYSLEHWVIERKDEQGRRWKLRCDWGGKFEITKEGQVIKGETILAIGEPVISTLEAKKDKDTYFFSQAIEGRDGGRIAITCDGGRPRPPKLHISSLDGKYDRTFDFEYG